MIKINMMRGKYSGRYFWLPNIFDFMPQRWLFISNGLPIYMPILSLRNWKCKYPKIKLSTKEVVIPMQIFSDIQQRQQDAR